MFRVLGIMICITAVSGCSGGGGEPYTTMSVTVSADVSSGQIPLQVTFSATVTGGQADYNYNWDFKDGNFSTEQNPVHTYTTVGNYAALCTVTDGKEKTASDFVRVITSDNTLQASITSDPLQGDAPLTVTFSATASGGAEPYLFFWDFKDGNTSNLEDPVHTFQTAGTYVVGLFVTDDNGTIVDKTTQIQVNLGIDDDDQDGIENDLDNCVSVANPGQENSDDIEFEFDHLGGSPLTDCILPNLCIWRDTGGPIKVLDKNGVEIQGAVVEWGCGICESLPADWYPAMGLSDFRDACFNGQHQQNVPGSDVCLHLIEIDHYWDIHWLTWDSGGIFSYIRKSQDGIGDACDCCWIIPNDSQLDSDQSCPAVPFASDPLCCDACQE